MAGGLNGILNTLLATVEPGQDVCWLMPSTPAWSTGPTRVAGGGNSVWPFVVPALRLPGLSVSALGDGMAIVAVSWLALQLAPPGQRGTWVAVAVAAYTLPSVVGTLVFGRAGWRTP